MANGHLCFVTAKLYQPNICVDRDVDVGVLLSKPIEARDQPCARKCRFDADPKHGLGGSARICESRRSISSKLAVNGCRRNWPASVNSIRLCRRSNSGLPMKVSNSRICRLIAACDTNSSSAARLKLRQAARSLKASHCRQR